jgi:hypothetical protein
MIITLDGQEHRDVSTLKRGDVFKTNRDGRTLPWSSWFLATRDPVFKMHTIPKKKRRWCLEGSKMLSTDEVESLRSTSTQNES